MAKSKYESHVLPRLEEIKDWARNGAIEEQIYKRLGIGHSAFNDYKNKHAELSEALKDTKDYCDAKIENALYTAALNGNITAQIFWLKNRRPGQWRENPANKETSDESPININISFEDCSGADK